MLITEHNIIYRQYKYMIFRVVSKYNVGLLVCTFKRNDRPPKTGAPVRINTVRRTSLVICSHYKLISAVVSGGNVRAHLNLPLTIASGIHCSHVDSVPVLRVG